MDKYAKLLQSLRKVSRANSIMLLNAEVTEITGESCTVKVLDDLILTEVRIKATISGSNNMLLLIPKVGSKVIIGSLTGDLKDMAVLSIDELELLTWEQDGLKVSIDAKTGKVEIANDKTSFKDIFQQLTDLLTKFKVTTPNGPSAALVPDTLAAVKQFENSFKMILK